MIVGGVMVIPAVSSGEDLGPRAHVRVGDMIVGIKPDDGKPFPLLIRTPEQVETFYRAVGIDYWTQDVDWVDA